MKKFQFMALLLAAALSTACQRSLDREDSQSFDGEKGYVSLSLNLPTVSGTKANDEFDDGDESEYKVDNAYIAFFYGADEATAVCKYAISIDKADGIFAEPAGDNITSTFVTGAVEVPAKEANENVYALAVLNPVDGLSVNAEGDLTLNGNSEDLTMADFQMALDASALEGHANSFMMTNAPVYDATDGIVTLTPVTVHTEKSHVENAAPDKIYVERVEAKVTLEVSKDATDNTLTVEDGTFAGATVKIDGWYLQNTNRKYYPVRKTNEQWLNADNYGTVGDNNRFVGAFLPQRIYWAEDHNYNDAVSDEKLASEFNIVTDEPASWNAVGGRAYCAENTTIAKVMNKKQLTGVLIRATYTPSGLSKGESFLITGQFNTVYSETKFKEWVLATLGHPSGTVEIIAKDGAAVTDAEGLKGLITINDSAPTDDEADKLLAAADNSIKYYQEGVSYYYSSIIRHFEDGQTPLADGGVSDEGEYDENKHLGRYGVVRNNWYQLTVNSVSGPGEPEIPGIPDEPADARTSYINCEINVLSWAVRKQEIDL
ncbi:MAG TPA: Mfa1 fimbrilin C-terminal domain-containing protein [Candidatus Coprenecus merdigallinarum]|nr:Mfa1 fimbrilin C-terminal domain-containing protein [Candidatus Coprenecus merdigallinarum]